MRSRVRPSPAQFAVSLVGHGFEPLVGSVLARDFKGEVCKPAVGCRSVPMLDPSGDVDDVARQHLYGGFALLLIPSASGHAHQHLSSALGGVVDVPVVAAARLEGDVGERYLLGGHTCQIAPAGEVLCVGRVGLADGEY